MSRPRYGWWPYIKSMIRRYPQLRSTPDEALSAVDRREYDAVRQAADETMQLPGGDARLGVIELMFWRRSHTLEGAAAAVHVSERTARRYHTDFIRLVAKKYGLLE